MTRKNRTQLARVLGTITAIILLLYIFDYGYIFKGIRVVYFTGHSTAYIDDFEHFESKKIHSTHPEPWIKHPDYNQIHPPKRLIDTHEDLETVAFVVIQGNQLWHEWYRDGYAPENNKQTNSFSMAKSVVTLLLGKAIMQGKIDSLDQPVGDFIPEFNSGKAADLTLGDLSSMSSGLDWNEHYISPFSITARSYYTTDLRTLTRGLEVVEAPGMVFKYKSGATQLLAMALEKALGMSLSDYLSTEFWGPMGMEQEALWQVDSRSSGLEKAYCCIGSNARDFARLGVLINQQGMFNKKQLLPKSFIHTITQPRFKESPHYGYGFWLTKFRNKKVYYMRGILGQYVIAVPEDQIVIVRLGHQRGPKTQNGYHFQEIFTYLETVYAMHAISQECVLGLIPDTHSKQSGGIENSELTIDHQEATHQLI